MKLIYKKKYKPKFKTSTISNRFTINKTYKIIAEIETPYNDIGYILHVMDDNNDVIKFGEKSRLSKCFERIV